LTWFNFLPFFRSDGYHITKTSHKSSEVNICNPGIRPNSVQVTTKKWIKLTHVSTSQPYDCNLQVKNHMSSHDNHIKNWFTNESRNSFSSSVSTHIAKSYKLSETLAVFFIFLSYAATLASTIFSHQTSKHTHLENLVVHFWDDHYSRHL
jgi:hypothetical protein